jgi:hypothetical protein
VYIDDIIIHSASHEEHLEQLDKALSRLTKHNLKANLAKCSFGASETNYLGFRLTQDGIIPGTDKLKAVRDAPPPSTVRQVRQFLGLCNFFRGHIQHFAQLTAPLTNLTKKDSSWKKGALPAAALRAFRHLQSLLCSEPVLAYPRRDRTYGLITDASFGDDKTAGGLGAILTQIDEKGKFHVIGYASRKLLKHEMNYTPFLLEMAACIFGMEHFGVNLKGRHFLLFTDHKPLEKLGKTHTKTLNRLQLMMNSFDFEIIYKKGSEMPADYLSRNAVDSIGMDLEQFALEQDKDDFLKALRLYLLNRALPNNDALSKVIVKVADACFVQNGVVWKRLDKQHEFRPCLYVPSHLKEKIISEAHGSELSGHFGLLKTKEAILNSYFWPNMEADISEHLKRCQKCQKILPNRNSPLILTPMPMPTEPNQRIHADLFGPLKSEDGSKKFILCLTDAFSKMVELVVIPNKEAGTVACAIVNKWICRYGVPLECHTDLGREFQNKLWHEISSLLGSKHTTTSPHHPQCNSQAEVCNKTIAKYLAAMVDESTLNWEQYIPALMFCYNTSFHRSIKTSPYFITFGIEPRTPSFFAADIRNFLKENYHTSLQRLAEARKIAIENNWFATEQYKHDHDKKAQVPNFLPNQLVLLDEFNFLNKNRKLAEKFSGPFRIVRLKGNNNAELVVNNGRRLIVNLQRLRPFQGNDVCDKLDVNDAVTNDLQTSPRGRDESENERERDPENTPEKHDNAESKKPDKNNLRKTTNGPQLTSHKRTHAHTHAHTLSPSLSRNLDRPLTRAQSRKMLEQTEGTKSLAALIATIAQQVLAIKKRLRKKQVSLGSSDPYKYGSGLEVESSLPDDVPDLGDDSGDDDNGDDDAVESDDHEAEDFDADNEEEENDPGTPGRWQEQEDGWKSWVEESDEESPSKFPSARLVVEGRQPISDQNLEQLLTEGGRPAKDFLDELLHQQRLFDHAYAWAMSKPNLNQKDREYLQFLRDKGARLKRLFDRVEAARKTTPDGLRHRTPYERRPSGQSSGAPHGRREGIKPKTLRFEDEAGPVSSRTRKHQPIPEDEAESDE